MAKKQKDILLDHDYDGIKELDNDLPPWWLYMFYLSIVFSVVYLLYFHVLGWGDLSAVEYEKEMNPNYVAVEKGSTSLIPTYHSPYYNPAGDVTPKIRKLFDSYIGPKVGFDALVKEAMVRGTEDQRESLKKTFPELWAEVSAGGVPAAAAKSAPAKEAAAPTAKDTGKKLKALTDAASLAKGKDIFQKNCVSCHGAQGQGGIGPNLTDDYWLHGAGINNVAHTITVGVPAKGMISWRGVLTDEQILQVASYVLTLHGTNPPNPKEPQGEKVEYPLPE